MGKLIDDNDLWFLLQRLIQIEISEGDTLVIYHLRRDCWQALKHCHGFGPGMGLHIAYQYIHTLLIKLLRLLQHGIGLTHTRAIAKKDFQMSDTLFIFPAAPFFLVYFF